MNIQEVRDIAVTYGIKPGKQNKTVLIKSIQRQEGNFDCFATAASGECDQMGCLWRRDCFAAAKRIRPS